LFFLASSEGELNLTRIISAPVAIGAGIIYGGARLFYGDEIDGWIDENWGYR